MIQDLHFPYCQGASTVVDSSQQGVITVPSNDPPDAMPTLKLDVIIQLMPTHALLMAQPFKCGIFKMPRNDDLVTWSQQVDPSTSQKLSTHAICANSEDVYIF